MPLTIWHVRHYTTIKVHPNSTRAIYTYILHNILHIIVCTMYYIRSTLSHTHTHTLGMRANSSCHTRPRSTRSESARRPCEIFSRHSNALLMYSSATMLMLDFIRVYNWWWWRDCWGRMGGMLGGGRYGKTELYLHNIIRVCYSCERDFTVLQPPPPAYSTDPY